MYRCLVCMYVYVPHAYMVPRSQKVLYPLELELQRLYAAMWVLRIKPRFSGRETRVPNCY